jgi:hypothetical protein
VSGGNPDFVTAPAAVGNGCPLGSTGSLTAAGTFTVTYSLTDNQMIDPVSGRVAVPARTAAVNASLIVRTAETVTLAQAGNATPGTALLDAVTARTYGIIGGTPTYTGAGGLGLRSNALFRWCFAAGALPAGFTTTPAIGATCAAPVASTTPVTIAANPAGAAGGPTAFTIQFDDTGNSAVAASTANAPTQITVQNTLASALAQATNATPNAALLDAVEARSYGVVGGTPTFSATGGLGSTLYRWCVSGGALPAGFVTNPVISTNCAAPTTAANVSVTANPAGAAGGPTAFTLQVDDTGNTAVPLGTDTEATQITILTGLTSTLTQATNATPNAALLDGVSGRSYGIVGATPTYAAAGGAGLGTYRWCVSAGALPAGFVTSPVISTNCAAPTTTDTVSVTANPAGAAGGPTAFTLQVDDGTAFNAAVPAGTSTQATNLTVRNVLSSTLTQATNATPNAALLNAVEARTYGIVGGTPTYSATGGGGAGTLRWCVSAGALPAGFVTNPVISTNCAAPTTTDTVTVTANPAGAAGGPTAFTLQVDDAGFANAAVPSGTDSEATNITILGPITMTLTQTGNAASPNPANLLDAVAGRTYAIGAQAGAAPTYSVSGGLGAGTYRWCYSAGAPPSGFSSSPIVVLAGCGTPTASNGPITLSANPASAAGPTSWTVQVDDTGNAAVPLGTATRTTSITTQAALASTLAQTGNATPNTALLNAVTARTYGIIGGTPTYSATGGGGSGTYRWCVSAGALPAGFVTSPVISTNCAAPTTTDTVTVTANPAGAPGGPTAFTLQVDDGTTFNAAVPGGTDTEATQITVLNALASTLAQATNATPNAALLDAIEGRSYGIIGGTPTYSATGGLGSAFYRWCVSAGALPAGFVTTVAISTNCAAPTANAGPIIVTANPAGVAGGPTAFTIRVDDTGNNAVPAGTDTEATQLTITAGITLTLTQAGNAGSPNPANLLDAVTTRSYGTIGGTPTFTATGGLGPAFYRWCVSAGALPAGFVTTVVISTNCAAPTLNAGPITVTSAAAGAAGGPTSFTIQVDDGAGGGNAAVPSGGSTRTTQLTIQPDVTVSVTPDPAVNDAVTGRSYGEAPQSPPTYTAADGIGPYTFTVSVGAPPTGIVCSQVAQTMECNTTSPTVVTGGTASFTVQAADTGNSAVPSGNGTLAKTITVQSALAITTAPQALTNGLRNHTYRLGQAGGPGFTFAATGGIGAQTWVAPGSSTAPCSGVNAPTGTLPTNMTVSAAGTLNGAPTSVSTSSVAPFSFGVCVFDTANATTPAGAATAANTDYTFFVMDQKAFIAGSNSDDVEVIITGNALSPTTDPATTGTVISLQAGDAPEAVAISSDGTKAFVTASGNDFVRVINTVDDSTGTDIDLSSFSTACTGPIGIASAAVNGGANNYTYVACAGSSNVAVFDTFTQVEVAVIAVGGGTGTPFGVAISPAGDAVYVTDNTLNQFYVIDPSTNTVVNTRNAGGATFNAPSGVVVSADGGRLIIANNGADNVVIMSPANSNTVLTTLSTTSNSAPINVQIDPTGAVAFVSLAGSGGTPVVGFGAISNATSGAPAISLVTPGTAGSFYDVTIPPLESVPAAGVRVFFTDQNNNEVPIHNGGAPFAAATITTNPLPLTITAPRGIRHIPIPR